MLETLAEARFEDQFVSCAVLQASYPGIQVIDTNTPVRATSKIVITTSDQTLDQKCFSLIDSPTVKLWLSHNNAVENAKVLSLPVLPDYCPDPKSLASINGNSRTITCKRLEKKCHKNWVYLGFRDSTNPGERQRLRHLFDGMKEATFSAYDRSQSGYSAYVDKVYNHRFVLSPSGNGIDCMRTWESLYLRTIPVVKRHPIMAFAEHLPILFVDDWKEATDLSFLAQEYERLMAKACDFNILRPSYWLSLFQST